MTDEIQNNFATIIGYSAFELFDQSFEYYEKACFVADASESLRVFLADAAFSVNDYETVVVYISDILNDFGLSNGEYALEPEAFSRFQKEADSLGIQYTVTPDEGVTDEKPDLFIVHVNRLNMGAGEMEPVQEIMEDLSLYEGFYKRESVDAAIEHKDEITPFLIAILEEILVSPDEYAAREDYHAPVYAAMLLGHFREPKAHNAIVEVFCLPESILEALFGDLVYEDLPIILLRTCGGSFDQIKSLALNRLAWTNCRYAALRAMVIATLDGVLDRDETLAFFSSLFTEKEAESQSDFWSLLATCVYDLYPDTVMEAIKGALDEGLIDPTVIGLQNFESALEQGKEAFLEKRRVEEQEKSLDDIHGRMSWWACFNQEKDMTRISSSPRPKPKKAKPDKKKKKNTKKMRKTSKKKNRK